MCIAVLLRMHSRHRFLIALLSAVSLLSCWACATGGVEPDAPAPAVEPDAVEPDGGEPAPIPEQDFAWQSIDVDTAPPAQWAHVLGDLGDGRAIVFGGTTLGDFGGETHDTTFLFDATTTPPTFEQLPVTGPSPRYCGCAAYDPDHRKVLVVGGRIGGTLLNDTWAFDVDENVWEVIPGNGPARGLGCALTHFADGNLYLFGGSSTSGTGNEMWSFSFDSNSWTPLVPPSPPGRRYDAALIATDDFIWMAGGSESTPSGFKNDVWRFDPDEQTWTELLPNDEDALPRGRRVPWVRKAPDNSGFYFGFGNNGGTVLNDLWFYDADANAFVEQDLPQAPPPRGWTQALPGGRGVIGVLFNGFDLSNPVGDVWQLLADDEDLPWWSTN